LARWYLCPLAFYFAARIKTTRIRPGHLTLAGLAAALLSAIAMGAGPSWHLLAGVLVLVYWFFDRADGQLARLQGTASPWGVWLDANVDELVDLGLHAIVAASLAVAWDHPWPWWLLAAFFSGKYLFMYSLWLDPTAAAPSTLRNVNKDSSPDSTLRASYHFLANADVRVHLLAAALFANALSAELTLIALYYNVRWIARYALLARRLRSAPSC